MGNGHRGLGLRKVLRCLESQSQGHDEVSTCGLTGNTKGSIGKSLHDLEGIFEGGGPRMLGGKTIRRGKDRELTVRSEAGQDFLVRVAGTKDVRAPVEVHQHGALVTVGDRAREKPLARNAPKAPCFTTNLA